MHIYFLIFKKGQSTIRNTLSRIAAAKDNAKRKQKNTNLLLWKPIYLPWAFADRSGENLNQIVSRVTCLSIEFINASLCIKKCRCSLSVTMLIKLSYWKALNLNVGQLEGKRIKESFTMENGGEKSNRKNSNKYVTLFFYWTILDLPSTPCNYSLRFTFLLNKQCSDNVHLP